ncbi:hypothetical protein D3C81_1325410 [compost metagenome]
MPGQIILCISRILDRFVNTLQKQPLLRIHKFRFSWRYMKELWIELVNVVNESPPFAVSLTRFPLLCVVVQAVIPAFVRNLYDAIFPVSQIPPEFLDIICLRVASRQPDDRDSVVLLHGLIALTRSFNRTLHMQERGAMSRDDRRGLRLL